MLCLCPCLTLSAQEHVRTHIFLACHHRTGPESTPRWSWTCSVSVAIYHVSITSSTVVAAIAMALIRCIAARSSARARRPWVTTGIPLIKYGMIYWAEAAEVDSAPVATTPGVADSSEKLVHQSAAGLASSQATITTDDGAVLNGPALLKQRKPRLAKETTGPVVRQPVELVVRPNLPQRLKGR